MEVNQIITLEDGKEYLVLLENEITSGDYFLTVEIKNNKQTYNYKVLKSVINKDGNFVEEVQDKKLLSNLLIDYKLQFDELMDDLIEAEKKGE